MCNGFLGKLKKTLKSFKKYIIHFTTLAQAENDSPASTESSICCGFPVMSLELSLKPSTHCLQH